MLADTLGRALANLRLSVTDRCNLRCQYCMPEQDYVWLPRADILHFEEIERLVDVFLDLGVRRLRLTGGEPLLRQELPILVERLAAKDRIEDLAMTTNGVLFAPMARELKRAGLHRVTVSLDTLHADRFQRLTRANEFDRVMAGMDAAADVFPGFKIDMVVIKGTNDDEIVDMVEFAKERGAELRFIEYMDVGGATRWSWAQVMTRAEMLATLSAHYGAVEPLQEVSSAPADRYRLADGTTVGVISSTTEPFCRDCDRSRLTADGMWYLCLYAARGTDLRAPLRAGASLDEIRSLITETWRARADRGAEARLALRDRSSMIPLSSLKRDPHLEMHTRGG
jgi:cyclic pyranopterin phosphate synthase